MFSCHGVGLYWDPHDQVVVTTHTIPFMIISFANVATRDIALRPHISDHKYHNANSTLYLYQTTTLTKYASVINMDKYCPCFESYNKTFHFQKFYTYTI